MQTVSVAMSLPDIIVAEKTVDVHPGGLMPKLLKLIRLLSSTR